MLSVHPVALSCILTPPLKAKVKPINFFFFYKILNWKKTLKFT